MLTAHLPSFATRGWPILGLLAGLSACATATPEPLSPLAQLQTLTAAPHCTTDSQCRTLPVGARACGGPSRYLVWSTRVNREVELQALAAQVTAQEKAALAASGRMSICQVLPDPGAHCDLGLGQCVAGGVGTARPDAPSR